MNFRIGFGIDVHRFSQDRKLMLGGLEIPSDKGLLGHSDADLVIHAICDALLGAAALRDIGFHFPDTNPAFKDADSKKLLARVADLMHQKGWLIGNIDCTIALQSPKISSFIPGMQKVLAAILGIEPENISIKATTTEGLGYEGRQEGATAYAVALIYRDSSSGK